MFLHHRRFCITEVSKITPFEKSFLIGNDSVLGGFSE